jgi:asparagine synthase (glutamine-hydrolysing)
MVSPDDYLQLTTSLRCDIKYDSFAAFYARIQAIERRTSESANPLADAALIFEMETFLQGLLIVEDKASMAHGLEVRVPLLDNEVIDAALATPFEFKVGFTGSGLHEQYGKGSSKMPAYANGKKILRDVLAAYVPEDVASARKQGFSPPFETWFRTGLRPWLEVDVFGSKSILSDLVDMRVARRLWGEHVNGYANHRLFVWGMISLYLSINSFKLKAS